MPPSLSADEHEAWRALLGAHAYLVSTIDRELRSAGLLPLDWYDVLLVLKKAPEQRLRLAALASAVLLTRSGISRLVTTLERKGLVERIPCHEDGRGFFAQLTPEGLARQRATWPTYRRLIAEHFGAHLDAKQARAIAKGLQRVRP